MSPSAESLVLIADDDAALRDLVERWLTRAGYEVAVAGDGEACLAFLEEEMPAAVCLDMGMPGLDGLEVLERIRSHNTVLPVIVLTADDSVDTVVRAMRLGAYDYLIKPLDQTKLLTTLRNAVDAYRLSLRVSQLEREAEGRGYPGIAGNSPVMRQVFRQIDRLAVTDVTVLIHGESGTGKELIARAIHESSGRARLPFVAVNSAAIPESLIESELFGHEKGAFTGAVTRRAGFFEEANRGTLFLDEIGELPLPVQAKLLRVLQEKKVQRVGGGAPVPCDFRLISATHRDLAEEVKAGRFREDLFFRVAVFELEVPPLRRRREDIPVLVQSFIRQHGPAARSTVSGVHPAAMDLLLQHSWPGNVRELQNAIQRALVVAEGDEIQARDLPERVRAAAGASISAAPGDSEPEGTLEDASRRLLVAALTKHGGNASAAMREMNVGRTRFYRMIKKFGLEGTIGQLRQGA